jgi:hypothetical protein
MKSEDILKNGKILTQNIDLIIKGIMVAFWNGNGIYVPKNLKFYDSRVLDIIKTLNIICNFTVFSLLFILKLIYVNIKKYMLKSRNNNHLLLMKFDKS